MLVGMLRTLSQDPGVYEAIGTVGAFTLATAVYVSSWRDRRREQASLVSAWIEEDSGQVGVNELAHTYSLCLLNASEQPVHSLHVGALGPPRTEGVQHVPTLLPPGKLTIPADTGALAPIGLLDDLPAPVTLAFTDLQGRRWHRLDPRDRLRRCRFWHRHNEPRPWLTNAHRH